MHGAERSRPVRRALALPALFLSQVVLGVLLTELALRFLRDPEVHATLWWPLSGLGLVLMVRLARPSRWSAALLGLTVGQAGALAAIQFTVAEAIGLSAKSLLEIVVLGGLLRWYRPRGFVLDGLRPAIVFTVGALGGVAAGALAHALVRTASGDTDVLHFVVQSARGHLLGLLLVAPVFLRTPERIDGRRELARHRTNREWAAQILVVLLATTALLATDGITLTTIVLLPLAWGAQRLGPGRAAVSLLVAVAALTAGVANDLGPQGRLSGSQQVLVLEAVLVIAAATVLFVGRAAAEAARLRSEAAGLDSEARSARRLLAASERIAGTGSVIWDPATEQMHWSDGLHHQLGIPVGSVLPSNAAYLGFVDPDDVGKLESADDIAAPVEYRVVRPDGSVRVVVGVSEEDDERHQVVSTVLDITDLRSTEEALSRSHHELAAVLDAVTEVAIIGASLDDGVITFFNQAAENLLGWRAEEVVGRQSPMIFHLVDDQERAMAETGQDDPLLAMADLIRDGARRWTCVRRDGTHFPAQLSLTAYLGPDGRPEGVIGTMADLGPALRTEAELQESRDRFHLAFESAPIGVAVVALDGTLLRVNAAWCAFTQRSEDELVGSPIASGILPGLVSGENGPVEAESAFLRPDGSVVWGLVSVSTVRPTDDRPPYLIVMVQDVTARRELNARLEHEATHDHLTGLSNRNHFRRRLDLVLEERRNEDSDAMVALLFIDLDEFRTVNDSVGHGVGDELLVEAANRIQKCVREGDLVARLGGDEFAVLCPGVPDAATSRKLGKRIVAELAREFELTTARCRIGGSVGVALTLGEDGPEQLLEAADQAVYEAKRKGKGRVRMGRS